MRVERALLPIVQLLLDRRVSVLQTLPPPRHLPPTYLLVAAANRHDLVQTRRRPLVLILELVVLAKAIRTRGEARTLRG